MAPAAPHGTERTAPERTAPDRTREVGATRQDALDWLAGRTAFEALLAELRELAGSSAPQPRGSGPRPPSDAETSVS